MTPTIPPTSNAKPTQSKAEKVFQLLDDWGNATMTTDPIPNGTAFSLGPLAFGDNLIGLIAKGTGKAGTAITKVLTKADDVAKVAGKITKWSSGTVSDAAKQLDNGATTVTVKTRAEAEELFLGIYQGTGYKNVTGMDAMDSKNLLGTKANTYQWDDVLGADGRVLGHSPTSADGAMPHLQIHPEKGLVIRIFFE